MIYLYENVTPNRGQNTHYVFSTLANYVTAIATASTNTTSFAEDSYRINSGVCMVYYNANNKPALRLHNITYLRHVYTDTSNTTVTTFYHVTRAEMEAGYLRLYLTRDDWATYYAQAKKSNIFAERCSKKLGFPGVYPETGLVGSETVADLLNDSNVRFFSPTKSNYAIVYVVAETIDGTLFDNNKGTKTTIYANRLNQILTGGAQDNPALSFNQICNAIGGIKGNSAGSSAVLRAYMIPDAMLSTFEAFEYPLMDAMKMETAFGNNGRNYVYPQFIVSPGLKSYSRVFSATASSAIQYVGTRFKLKKLPRVNQAGRVSIKFHFITKTDSMEIVMQVGEEFIDITDQFSLTLGATNGGVTSTEDTRRSVQGIGSIISTGISVGAAVATGNPLMMLGMVPGALSNTTNLLYQQTSGATSIQGGDASSNCFTRSIDPQQMSYVDEYLYPFKLVTFSSWESLNVKTGHIGLQYNQVIDSIIPANTDPFIHVAGLAGEGTQAAEGYYFKGSVNITGVQTDAAQFMENELAGGIYVKAV